MKGDVINIEKCHYDAARKIIKKILHNIINANRIFSISVAGESGSGKSETAKALQKEFTKYSIASIIFQQDDYFELPPRSNDQKRRKDFEWIGPQEVKLKLIDEQIQRIKNGASSIIKPLVHFDEDTITEETVLTRDIKVIIVEGTYTSLLKNINCKIFISRTKFDTKLAREKRSRAAHELDEYADKILEKEHRIISKHKSLSDIIISNTFDVIFNLVSEST